MENIKDYAEFNGAVQELPLSSLTTMRTGGTAVVATPQDERSLCAVMGFCAANGIRTFVLGGGSNVIAPDEGFDGVVVLTRSLCAITCLPGNDGTCLVTCGAGARTDSLVDFCVLHGLCGMQTFAGLPGTIGGAAYMNARCYGHSISEHLQTARHAEPCPGTGFAIRDYTLNPADWDYKRSPFMQGGRVILSVTLSLDLHPAVDASAFRDALRSRGQPPQADPGTQAELRADCDAYVADRRAKGHFDYASAGSVFKNDRRFGKPSGALIDQAGLCGTTYGGAQVAPWHGNFIINTGTATAHDIRTLVGTIQRAVQERTGFTLEPEVVFM